jgi:hypothetical protein
VVTIESSEGNIRGVHDEHQLKIPKSKNQLSFQSSIYEWPEILSLLDNVCNQIAERYDLFSGGYPRKATIVEVMARNTCIACAEKELRNKSIQRIDTMYTELHQLACSMLIEELYSQLVENDLTVTITTEEHTEYGKVDIFIVPFSYGLNLYSKQMKIAVEVKTGFSFSLPQLFRYMMDGGRESLILWRIRNSQVLVFEMTEIKPLLAQFAKMVTFRANRLLLAHEPECKHIANCRNWSPTQHHLQATFSDFSEGVIKTLPKVVETILTRLGERGNKFVTP